METAEYQVGDKVVIRSDLKVGKAYGEAAFAFGMINYYGKGATITHAVEGLYHIDLDSKLCVQYWWSPRMFENQRTYHTGDEVLIREDLVTGKTYGDIEFTKYMERCKGMTTKITAVIGPNLYFIEAEDKHGHWWWTSQMFEN